MTLRWQRIAASFSGDAMNVHSLLVGALLGAIVAAPAQAASQRTFVSTQGIDNATCSLAAPCRTFAAAIAATIAAGEVIVLDSGGYGTVGIAQSVSIVAPPGIYAGITTSQIGISIHGSNINVVLRGLSVNSPGNGMYGISVTGGASVKIEGCEISGMTGSQSASLPSAGIRIGTTTSVTVVDSMVRDNFVGILVESGKADVSGTTVIGNQYFGVWAHPTLPNDTVRVTVTDSVASNNTWGFGASGTASSVGKMSVSRSTASHNMIGYLSDGSSALMVVAASVATGNSGYGFSNVNGGTFRSFGNNFLSDNALFDTNGVITPTTPQ